MSKVAFHKIKIRIASKVHTCTICGRHITVGEVYKKEWSRKKSTVKYCRFCSR